MAVVLEQYTNSAQTTLNGGISSGSTSLVVTSTTNFPTAPQFRIIVDAEIMLVTAVAGTTYTVSRGQEGTTAASHLTGVAVTHVLTQASLSTIIGQFALSDLIANRPAAGTNGRLFFPSDGGPIFRDNGSAWDCWAYGMGPFTPPLSTFTTAFNRGNYVLTQNRGVSTLSILGSVAPGSDSICGQVDPVPGASWTMTVAYNHSLAPGCPSIGGIVMYDSVSTKCKLHVIQTSGSPAVAGYDFNTPTSFNSSIYNDATYIENHPLMLLQVVCDGTTYFYNHSEDFITWVNNRQELVSGNFLTPTHIGYFVDFGSGSMRSNQTDAMTFYHAKLTSP